VNADNWNNIFMNKVILVLLLIPAFILSSCMTPQERRTYVKKSNDFDLCWDFSNVSKTLQREMYNELRNEISKRNINCNYYAGQIANKRNNLFQGALLSLEMMENSTYVIQDGVRKPVNGVVPSPSTSLTQSNTPTGTPLNSQWIKGTYRYCSYGAGVNKHITTVSTSTLCPMSLTNNMKNYNSDLNTVINKNKSSNTMTQSLSQQWRDGSNRVCVYGTGNNKKIQTISASGNCPLVY